VKHIARLLRDATALVDKETRDLRALDFSRLREFAEKKSRLVAEIERSIAKLDGSHTNDFIVALEDLRAKTSENEKLFEATRQGFADAKARLAALRASDSTPGFYGADGEKRHAPDRGATRGNL
jgi:hypothetical protein